LTVFPLLGLHAVTSCESCHLEQGFSRTETSCQACHATEDVHKESLGTDCGRCHNPNGWGLWRFDHDADTKFALQGKHAGLECAGCHRLPISKKARLSDDCIDCHAAEDAHRGGFGRGCGDCHSADAWKPANFGRGRGARQ
jgi:hypothetical protein